MIENLDRRPWLAAGMAFACVLGAVTPAQAAPGDAQKLRRMDIMLMVTGLRCRATQDDFMAEYGRFTSSHMAELNQANAELRAELGDSADAPGGALDRLSVVMANEYGGGHPWLSCRELHDVTQNLAVVQGRETLVEVAGQLLDRQPPVLFALARR